MDFAAIRDVRYAMSDASIFVVPQRDVATRVSQLAGYGGMTLHERARRGLELTTRIGLRGQSHCPWRSVLPTARICPYFYGNSTCNPQYGNAVVDSANLKKSKPISKSFTLKQISVSNWPHTMPWGSINLLLTNINSGYFVKLDTTLVPGWQHARWVFRAMPLYHKPGSFSPFFFIVSSSSSSSSSCTVLQEILVRNFVSSLSSSKFLTILNSWLTFFTNRKSGMRNIRSWM